MQVPIGMFATPLACLRAGSAEWNGHLLLGLVLTLVNAALVQTQFKGHVGLAKPPATSDASRMTLTAVQFVFAMWSVKFHYGAHLFWYPYPSG